MTLFFNSFPMCIDFHVYHFMHPEFHMTLFLCSTVSDLSYAVVSVRCELFLPVLTHSIAVYGIQKQWRPGREQLCWYHHRVTICSTTICQKQFFFPRAVLV